MRLCIFETLTNVHTSTIYINLSVWTYIDLINLTNATKETENLTRQLLFHQILQFRFVDTIISNVSYPTYICVGCIVSCIYGYFEDVEKQKNTHNMREYVQYPNYTLSLHSKLSNNTLSVTSTK